MTPEQTAIAHAAHAGATEGRNSFPESLALLAHHGFEGYLVDLRRGTSRYYLADGDSTEVAGMAHDVAPAFEAAALQSAIRAAQAGGPGYSYRDFCQSAGKAGCAGYIVSLPGRRVLYFARTGETHVEHFPAGK
jgi:uncharacterized protein YbcV (DUF1398 family)